jgi:hypothetical protein
MEAESVSIAENAPSVIQARQHHAPAHDAAEALLAATDYAVREMRDNAEPGPAAFRRLLSNIQARWPTLDSDDRSFAAGYASGVVETQGRLLARVPIMGEVGRQ